jgi:hypothetical protein
VGIEFGLATQLHGRFRSDLEKIPDAGPAGKILSARGWCCVSDGAHQKIMIVWSFGFGFHGFDIPGLRILYRKLSYGSVLNFLDFG